MTLAVEAGSGAGPAMIGALVGAGIGFGAIAISMRSRQQEDRRRYWLGPILAENAYRAAVIVRLAQATVAFAIVGIVGVATGSTAGWIAGFIGVGVGIIGFFVNAFIARSEAGRD
jgi:hypothetical protein